MGAGYHGGFGQTKGADKKAHTSNSLPRRKSDYTRNEIIAELMGVTEVSDTVARLINEGKIRITLLSDELFESYLGKSRDVGGTQKGNMIYLRRSVENLFSTVVHEGTHVLDFYKGVPQNEIGSFSGEAQAYINEHAFQKEKGQKLEHENIDDIKIFVAMNYKRRN